MMIMIKMITMIKMIKWTCDLVATMTMTPMMMIRKSKMMMQILTISKIIKMADLSRLRSSAHCNGGSLATKTVLGKARVVPEV